MGVIDSIVKLEPINTLARIVTGKGQDFIPDKKVLTADSEYPIPIKKIPKTANAQSTFVDLTGRKVGRLTVLGMSEHYRGKWVVRCSCGVYTIRTAKALKNVANSLDRCEHCRHLAFLKRAEAHRRTGKEFGWEK